MKNWWKRLDPAKRNLYLLMLAFSVVAGGLILASTQFGAGIGTDGVVYVAAARNFLTGDGISWVGPQADIRPLAIFAPLLPFVLAIGSFLSGQDAWEVARWLNALLFAINISLLIKFVHWYSRKTWLAITAGMIFLYSRSMISMHTNVFSEPLFLALLVGAFFLLSIHLANRKPVYLWTSAVLMAFSFLARYAGIYFIVGGAISLFLFLDIPWRKRVKPTTIWVAINLVVVGSWFTRNQLVAGSGTSRQWAPSFPPVELLQSMGEDITFWFLPEFGPLWLRLTAVILGLILLVLAWWWFGPTRLASTTNDDGSGKQKSIWMLGLVLAIYLAGLLATRSLVVPRIDIISRTLIPAYVLVLLSIFLVISDVFDGMVRLDRTFLARGIQLALIAFAITYLLRGSELVLKLQEDGQEYARLQWQNSPLLNAMDLLPPDTPIYTNHVEAVYLFTGRHPYRLPYGCLPEDILVDQYAQADCQEPEYLEWVESMQDKLDNDQAVIALFGRTYEQVYDPLIPDLIEGLETLTIQGDGSIYVRDVDQWPENPHW